jgi:hypothetical protein
VTLSTRIDDRDNPWADQAERDAEEHEERAFCEHDVDDRDWCLDCEDEALAARRKGNADAAVAFATKHAESLCGKAYNDAEVEAMLDAVYAAGFETEAEWLHDELTAAYLAVRLTVGAAPEAKVVA